MSDTDPVLLVGMSVREVQARELLLDLAAPHGAGVAFLQQGDPTLSVELTRLADLGAERIVVIGVSLGSMAPAVSWLRRICGYWWRERPGHRPEVAVGTSLATDAAEVRALLGLTRPITGTEAGLTSAAWEDVPEHRHQVLVCRGPRCTALGSDKTTEALIIEMMRQGLGDDDVLITHTGCQFPCNQAPVVSIQPDDVWYAHVDPEVAGRIVREHVVAGHPVEDQRLARIRRTPGPD
jgi:(2Fe-2S) ferredoxin